MATRLFRAELPSRTTWHHVQGISWLAGVGFTKLLSVDGLAFERRPDAFEASKIATLAASSFLVHSTRSLRL